MKTLLTIILTFLFSSLSYGWDYLPVPTSYIENFYPTESERDSVLATADDWYNLTDALPAGYDTTGSVDYTDFLQAALIENRNCIMPNFPVKISISPVSGIFSKGLRLYSNSKLYFPPNAKIIQAPTDVWAFGVILVRDAENVQIFFPEVQGDRYEHLSTLEGGGACIYIQSSSFVYVLKPHVYDSWGDGITLSNNWDYDPPSHNVRIDYARIDNCQRNGLTFVCARDSEVNHAFISNTNGSSPNAGVIIEPEFNTDIIEGIVLNDVTTFNTLSFGVKIPLKYLRQGPIEPVVDVTFNRHKDINTIRAIEIEISSHSYAEYPPVSGQIVFNFPEWRHRITHSNHVGNFVRDVVGDTELDVVFNYGRCPDSVYQCIMGDKMRDYLEGFNAPNPIPSFLHVSCKEVLSSGATQEKVWEGDASAVVTICSDSVPTALPPIQAKKSFRFYPNPAADVLQIHAEKPVYATIFIHDMNGRLRLQDEFDGRYGAIDISSLEPGVYLLEVRAGSSKTLERFVKI